MTMANQTVTIGSSVGLLQDFNKNFDVKSHWNLFLFDVKGISGENLANG